MTRMTSTAGRVFLVFLLLAQGVAAGEVHRFQRLFNHYNSIRRALAADTISGVSYHAEQLGLLARTLAGEARRSGKKEDRAVADELRAISDAAREVAYSTDIKGARAAFAKLSRALVAYRGVAGVEDPVVVFCLLHNNVWLQRSNEDIGNPYMGAHRASCGETLRLRKPGWLPGRPSSGSPGVPSPQDTGWWGRN
ncbi:MAG: DUF3347 domain-containing protein [Acidobacteria bacterium]|nr:DUF3347 domain-containing protein [Acidobacteriota bacterium]